MNEQRVHQIFVVSLLLKGAHALVECIGGLVLRLCQQQHVSAGQLADEGRAGRGSSSGAPDQ
ncbi:hypothetical protein [Mesorhizobium sp. SARCC-RB16n]|uniref:hypothetical protein n=1 Tax=Mesorhizobium sp. SARCC-RB16n TaxID=2116687 RepID=UPI001669DE7E|nr:hypothetical protein [Mesorhizobium sp. SARCC-RB16n]